MNRVGSEGCLSVKCTPQRAKSSIFCVQILPWAAEVKNLYSAKEVEAQMLFVMLKHFFKWLINGYNSKWKIPVCNTV